MEDNIMNIEMQAFEKNQIWEIVDLSEGNKPVECKWVFYIRYKANGQSRNIKRNWW